MSFATALSGLNAAANNLSVLGNNIANANTTGFKESRAEFADAYASSIGASSTGGGASVAKDIQLFSQGTVNTTSNNLDMAINGGGFFTLSASPTNPTNTQSLVYSRAGAFEVNKDGLVVNPQGQALLAYTPKTAGGFNLGSLTTVSLNSTTGGLPVSTTKVNLSVNLNAASPPLPATTPFRPTDPNSYTNQSSTTIYDSLGSTHNLTTYFVAGASGNWTAYHYITDNPAAPVSVDTGGTPTTLTFNATGQLTSTPTGALTPWTPVGSSVNPIALTMDYAGSTQLASAFGVNSLTQNGVAAGSLTGVSVDSSGIILAKFSNGSSTPLGQVALAMFINPQGLTQLGGTTWGQSVDSGTAIPGSAGVGRFGSIQSSALEQSNVDLSQELVNLIAAQQAYQANSQSISTENKIIETIMNAFR